MRNHESKNLQLCPHLRAATQQWASNFAKIQPRWKKRDNENWALPSKFHSKFNALPLTRLFCAVVAKDVPVNWELTLVRTVIAVNHFNIG